MVVRWEHYKRNVLGENDNVKPMEKKVSEIDDTLNEQKDELKKIRRGQEILTGEEIEEVD